ncbi:MAG: hypothetical protein P8Y71_29335, partial [Pseudolabrys sp.]
MSLEPAHDGKQLCNLGLAQNGGRFVEDQHVKVAQQQLENFDLLTLGDVERAHARVGIEVEAGIARDLAHLLAGLACRAAAGAEHGVLDDGEVVDQTQVLVDHANAG